MDSADFSDSSFGLLHSNPSSRFPSEDWVRQARGLSIGHTTPYESRSTNSSFEHLEMQSGDVDMVSSLHWPLEQLADCRALRWTLRTAPKE